MYIIYNFFHSRLSFEELARVRGTLSPERQNADLVL